MGMPQVASLLSFLLLVGYAFAGLSIWPSFHVALSNGHVLVDFNTNSNTSTISNITLSMVNMETNTTALTRTLPSSQLVGRVEVDCSCFLYAGTFRFLMRQTSIAAVSHANRTESTGTQSSTWWWSSELQVQWPTFHIAVERAGNHSQSFQVGISTNEHFRACSSGIDAALFLEVSYMESSQKGRNTTDKIRARTRKAIKPLRSQSVQLPCTFPFTEKDFIEVALKSPHTAQEVKSSGPLYLSRIFSYKLLVENAHAYKRGCEGTVTVKIMSPPCAYISGKVLLYSDASVGRGGAASAVMEFGPEEPSYPPLAVNWLTQGQNETEFNCSLFYPGKNKYCFHFVFNLSHSSSSSQTCLVVYRSAESWGPWQSWSVCSVSCGEGVRERVRDCLLPSGARGVQCTGMVKEQSQCSLEDCGELSSPTSLYPAPDGVKPLDGNMIVVLCIFLCLAVITTTVVVTVWKKLCRTPQCSSVHGGSMHSPGGRKLSDEASICGHSLQRPSLCDGHGPSGDISSQKDRPPFRTQSLVMSLSQDPERLSPTGQKVLPPIFGYRLAQQQLKEMKKKGLKEATQLYHVSSSPVVNTMGETSASPNTSPFSTLTEFAHFALPLGPHDNMNQNHLCIATPVSELSQETSKVTSDRLSPRVELVLGPHVSAQSSRKSSNCQERTADWVEMVKRSGLAGQGGDALSENTCHKNPHFRRTSSFNDSKPQLMSPAHSRQFRERSMTQVGSCMLPEGSVWTRREWERQPHRSNPIPEHTVSEWAKAKPQLNDHKKPWMETPASLLNNQLKHTRTNTNGLLAAKTPAEADLSGTAARVKAGGPEGGESASRIGGPPSGIPRFHKANQMSVDQAEQNWNRRGPSPIQRNMLARKLKEAQSCSGVNGRKRSSSFSVSPSEPRKDRCHSLPKSKNYNCGVSPYRLSEAEERMLDLDLFSVFVQEEGKNT